MQVEITRGAPGLFIRNPLRGNRAQVQPPSIRLTPRTLPSPPPFHTASSLALAIRLPGLYFPHG